MIIEIYCNKVHAQTTTISALNSSNVNRQWNTTANSWVESLDVSKFSSIYNIGEGVLNFTISIEGQYKVYGVEFIYRRSGTNKSSECQIGTNLNYKDSGSQIQTITSVCNINMDFKPTEISIYVYGYSWGNLWYGGLSNQITFSNFKDSTDYNNVLNNATEYLRVISVYTQYNNTDIYAIRSTLETIMTNLNTNNTELKNAITQQTQQAQQNWENFNNTDISEEAKQELDKTNTNDAQQKEQEAISNIQEELETKNPNFWQTLILYIDPNANSFIWNTFNAIMNSNQILLSLFITIATLGLAKLILGR